MMGSDYAELEKALGAKEAKKAASYAWKQRIKACGNGVVPQCAEFIGGIIIERLRAQE